MRFQARLSEPLPWTVTVADATGNVVASGTGDEPGHRLDLGRRDRGAGVVQLDDRGG